MSKKPEREDTLGKAIGLDGRPSVDDLLNKAQGILDGFHQSIAEIKRSNAQLKREIAEAEDRITKIEERDKAAGHTPYRWRTFTTHDAPELMQ
jgi:hypothetical protein